MPILFPATGLLDDFNRTDATGNINTAGHDWVRIVSSATLGFMQLTNRSPSDTPIDSVDGTAGANSNAAACRDVGRVYDSEVWATITALPVGSGAPQQQGVMLRMHDGGDTTASTFFQASSRYSGYTFRHRNDGNTEIFRLDSANAYGGDLQLATVGSIPWAVGDKIGLSIIGATLRGYRYDVGVGSWNQTPILTATDTVALAAGYPGLLQYSDAAAFGDIGGGTRVQAARLSFDYVQLPSNRTMVVVT